MSIRDSEMHVVAVVGAVVLTAVLFIPAAIWAGRASSDGDDDDDATKNRVIVEATLAARATPKKQPQKEFQAPPPPEKPQGVSRDADKQTKPQCCKSEADCNEAALPFPTMCPDDGTCESNRCIPKKRDKVANNDKPVTTIPPDRTSGLDTPTGTPTENTIGTFDGSKKGRAATNSGHPWLAHLATDFTNYVDFPSIEEASALIACLRIEKDGTITDTTLNPPNGKRSDNEGLNAKAENALKKITDDRKQKPQPVPTELLEQVVTKWQCIQIDAQTKQN